MFHEISVSVRYAALFGWKTNTRHGPTGSLCRLFVAVSPAVVPDRVDLSQAAHGLRFELYEESAGLAVDQRSWGGREPRPDA